MSNCKIKIISNELVLYIQSHEKHSHFNSREHIMSTEHLLIFLAIGILEGFLAGRIMKGKGFGLLGDLIVGNYGKREKKIRISVDFSV